MHDHYRGPVEPGPRPRDASDTLAGAAVFGMAALGVVRMALHPRKTLGVLFGGSGWNNDHCSCTRVPDAMDPNCAVHGERHHG